MSAASVGSYTLSRRERYPRARWISFLVARLLFAAILVFGSAYLILANVSVVYDLLHKGGMFPALNTAASLFPGMLAVGLILMFVFLIADRPNGTPAPAASRPIRWILLLSLAPAVVTIWATALLSNIHNDIYAFLWSLAMITPMLAVALIDWLDLAAKIEWNHKAPDEDYATFRAAFYAAGFLTLASTVTVYLRGLPEWTAESGSAAMIWSLAAHLLMGALLFTMFNLFSVISSWFSRPPLIMFLAAHVLIASLGALVLYSLVFGSISFTGYRAWTFSILFSTTLALYSSGLALRTQHRAKEAVISGVSLAFWLPQPTQSETDPPSAAKQLIALPALGVLSTLAILEAAQMDWNFVIQKLVVLIAWGLAFRIFFRFARLRQKAASHSGLMLAACLAMLFSYRTLQANSDLIWHYTDQGATGEQFLDRYAGYDVSLQLIRNSITPPEYANPGYYKFLASNTSIPRNVKLPVVPVKLVPEITPLPGPKPNIFIIVVDSLRQDYLGAYNPRVNFTPNLDQFAGESLVLKNAFSRYGGTIMSEPSIWAGTMLLHRQNLAPFAPVNNLEKLIQAEQYTSYVSVDSVLRPLLEPRGDFHELDEGRFTMDYDLCTTLQELERKAPPEIAGGKHVFSYTQPQNIHISVLQRRGNASISDRDYGSFFAPYASRLERMDACFGRFIQTLKDQGIYDNSIVVFTADHGDSLGEGGRWGHAYTIYPEIVEVPLLMHVPETLRQNLYFDPQQLTFTTDITPTLYYLLGHTDITHDEFPGKPLLTATEEEHAAYLQPRNLVASSYGSLWGILSGDSQTLYVSDGVNHKEYFFDLDNPLDAQPVNNAAKADYQFAIQEKITALGRMYGYDAAEAGGISAPEKEKTPASP